MATRLMLHNGRKIRPQNQRLIPFAFNLQIVYSGRKTRRPQNRRIIPLYFQHSDGTKWP